MTVTMTNTLLVVVTLSSSSFFAAVAPATTLKPDLARLLSQHSRQDVSSSGTTTHTALASLSRQNRHKPPPMATAVPRKPWGACPEELGASVNSSGLLPVDYFRPAGSNTTFDEATRLAINMTLNCGGIVFFATQGQFTSTVVVPGGTSLRGGGPAGAGQFTFRPQTEIKGPTDGPAFLIEHATNVQFHDLLIMGHTTGVIITDAAMVHFANVAIHAQSQGLGADDVNLTAAGCTDAGCNVVLGSNNTALVSSSPGPLACIHL